MIADILRTVVTALLVFYAARGVAAARAVGYAWGVLVAVAALLCLAASEANARPSSPRR